MPTSYRVTATSLNLRSGPGTDSSVLAVLRKGQLCVGGGPLQGGWLSVSFGPRSGFVSGAYVQATDSTVSDAEATPPPATPAVATADADGVAVPLPTSPETRLRSEDQLHPRFRSSLDALLHKLAAEDRPFKVFEAFRTPERQQWLYGQGRTQPGSIVTKAKPWESFHQYGLAVMSQ